MMNQPLPFNDTFDNFTFLECSNLNRNKNLNTNENVRNLAVKVTQHTTEEPVCSIQHHNISVDDSIFLKEFESQQHVDKELFANSLHSTQLEINANNVDLLSHDDVFDCCDLSSWGLPEQIVQKYKNRGIIKMFSWQAECLNDSKLLESNANLVYSAPTSAGKTLVAEILAIKTVIERKKKVLFVLPFISVVREKMFYFQDILSSTSGVRVEGFMGSYNPPGGFQPVQVAICTIEKANAIINHLLEDGNLGDLGAVIIDEIHLLGDSSRGYLLELMLTKLTYMTIRYENINIQIIGMSATLPNLKLLGTWLKAQLYITDFRPIPLYEQCLVSREIYNKNLVLERCLLNLKELETDSDNILQLCLETIENSCSVLIFCPTKNWCENLSQQIATAFWKLGCTKTMFGVMLRKELNGELIKELLEQLRGCPVGLDAILQKSVSYGVAFHHAGLTMDERDIIEGAFRNGTLRVLVATSTLSSGVNLPARRVIIRTPMFHGKPIDSLVYRQMIGRAGRMGKDTCGESILICQKNDYRIAKELLTAELQPIQSCLVEGAGKLKRAILEVVASGVAASPDDVRLFTRCTLLAATEDALLESFQSPVDDALGFLVENEFIRLQKLEDGSLKYIPTCLGKACLSSSMPPEEGLTLFSELEKARRCFVLETELHLIYLVTPYNVCNQWGNLDWMLFLELWEKLPANMKRVGDLVGVRESYIIGGSRNRIQSNTSKSYQKLQIHKRFFTSLALQDLVNEVPLNDVANKFGCSRGMLQSLQQSAATFAGMLTVFSRNLGWSSVEILISQFQDRLHFGVNRDLLDLMRLPILNGPRARVLFNAGIETLPQLASSDIYTIENILHKTGPFESEKERDGETEFDAHKRIKRKNIWVAGKEGLTEREAAVMLVQDSRRFLQLELGLAEAKWENTLPNKSSAMNLSGSTKNSQITTPDVTTKDTQEIQLTSSDPNAKASLDSSIRSIVLEKNRVSIDLVSASDQSLFEESFDHCVTYKKRDDINGVNATDDLSNTEKSGDSGLDFDLETAFVSSFNLQANINKADQSFLSNDLVFDSQTDNHESVITKSAARASVYRKCENMKDVNNATSLMDFNDDGDSIKIGETPAKKRKITKLNVPLFPAIDKVEKASLPLVDLTKLQIIDVSLNHELYKTFSGELSQQKTISISLACKTTLQNKPAIGTNILLQQNTIKETKTATSNDFINNERQLVGFALSWGSNVAHYVSFENPTILNSTKVALLRKTLSNKTLNIRMFDCKEQIKAVKLCCDLDVACVVEDPKVADWLIDPEGKEKNLQAMAVTYAPETINLSQLAGNCKGVGSVGLDLHSSVDPRIRASVEAIVTWYLCNSLRETLLEQNGAFLHTYKTEMSSVLCLARMELNGFGVNVSQLESLAENLNYHAKSLQKKAFSLAGRTFSFTSSTDVAKVLKMYKGRKVSTNKQSLEQQTNPIASIILQWRKLSSAMTKMVYPLVRAVRKGRIHGCCVLHNSTGRISMQEPNLQNVPRDFAVEDVAKNTETTVSCRLAFVPKESWVLLSADYCQLELRLLAHLSQDASLCRIMRSNEDVFKLVAAKWKSISETQVDDCLRQWAKQLCYGIIYGMGTKALAERLSVTEDEANLFIISFNEKYPGIKDYVLETINNCRRLGYVETLAGRKRFLPNINHGSPVLKSQAERQAVNTTVQGSAADLAKLAMVLIEERFRNKFRHPRNLPLLVLHLHDELMYEVQEKYLLKTAKILKKSMEEAVKLSVPFPVKLKSGTAWGAMKELKLADDSFN